MHPILHGNIAHTFFLNNLFLKWRLKESAFSWQTLWCHEQRVWATTLTCFILFSIYCSVWSLSWTTIFLFALDLGASEPTVIGGRINWCHLAFFSLVQEECANCNANDCFSNSSCNCFWVWSLKGTTAYTVLIIWLSRSTRQSSLPMFTFTPLYSVHFSLFLYCWRSQSLSPHFCSTYGIGPLLDHHHAENECTATVCLPDSAHSQVREQHLMWTLSGAPERHCQRPSGALRLHSFTMLYSW